MPTEPDADRREAYRELDRDMMEKREFYRSRAEQYPVLEDVIHGRNNLDALALALQKGFWKTFPRTVMILRYGGFLKEFTLPSMDKLMPFVEMVSELSERQTTQSVNYEQLLMQILCDMTDPYYGRKARERLKNFFLGIIGSAVLLDRSVHRSFMDILVQESPQLFKEEYARMNATDREYAEYTLSRMLGAGLLDMDEIELERIVREAREQAGRDDGAE